MNSLRIKKGDKVVVLSGRERGKEGKVLSTDAKSGKVLVEGVNIIQRHTKPRKQGEEGGIIKREAPLYASKVMRVCPKCNRPTRAAAKILENGEKARVCKKCGEPI